MIGFLRRILLDEQPGQRNSSAHRHTLRFKEPVNFALLEAACAALSTDGATVALGDVLENPREALGRRSVSLEAGERFLEVVWDDESSGKPPELSELPAGEAEALKTYAVADFFTHACRAISSGQARGYGQFLSAQASRKAPRST